jgi:hypothetical protein
MADTFESKLAELKKAKESHESLKEKLKYRKMLLKLMKENGVKPNVKLSHFVPAASEDDTFLIEASFKITTDEELEFIENMLIKNISELENEKKEIETKYGISE